MITIFTRLEQPEEVSAKRTIQDIPAGILTPKYSHQLTVNVFIYQRIIANIH